MSYDPRLREAMSKIEKICEEFDCGAYVSLTSETHGEFRFVLPKWGCLYEDVDSQQREIIRLKTVNMKNDIVMQRKAELTAHFVFGTMDMMGTTFLLLNKFKDEMQEKWKVEHKAFHEFEPKRKDVN